MSEKFDVVALGELLIDFTPAGISPSNMLLYERNPGGAPANMLTSLARQGGSAAFIGKVGKDSFGFFLKDTLVSNKINVSGLVFENDTGTTLAFVTLEKNGERSFTFFRNPGADTLLHPDDVDESIIKNSKIFHFGSISLTHQPARSATRYAIELAKDNNLKISYDPNLRPLLWKSEDAARKQITMHLPDVDILKINQAEFQFITGHSDYKKGVDELIKKYNITYIFVTLGAKGAFYAHNGLTGHIPTYNTSVVDTTGSGDAFSGTILKALSSLEDKTFYNNNEKDLVTLVKKANASGSIASTKRGGMPSMPTEDDIDFCMKNIPILY